MMDSKFTLSGIFASSSVERGAGWDWGSWGIVRTQAKNGILCSDPSKQEVMQDPLLRAADVLCAVPVPWAHASAVPNGSCRVTLTEWKIWFWKHWSRYSKSRRRWMIVRFPPGARGWGRSGMGASGGIARPATTRPGLRELLLPREAAHTIQNYVIWNNETQMPWSNGDLFSPGGADYRIDGPAEERYLSSLLGDTSQRYKEQFVSASAWSLRMFL